MNNHHTPRRGPTARCKTFAALLPLLDEPGIDPDALAEARAHLDTCAYCQQQRAAYRQLELAARRHLAPPASPRYQTEEIIRDLLGAPIAEPVTGKTTTARPTRLTPPQPGSARRFLAGLPALAAVLVIVLLSVALFANHLKFVPGSASSTTTPGSDTELRDVAMVSPTEGWAVGETRSCDTAPASSPTASGPNSSPTPACHSGILLMHYLHSKWSPVHLPFQVGGLSTISALSPTDVWAAGNTIILHYDGHTWQDMPNPEHYILTDMQMLSDTDGWATGSSGGGMYEPGLLLHFDGHTWTPQTLPANLANSQQAVDLGNVTMISPTEGWLLATVYGGSPPQVGFILHYTHGQWTIQDRIDNASVGSIWMPSATDGWATGITLTDTPTDANGTPQTSNTTPLPTTRLLLLHYIQGKWVDVTNSYSSLFNGAGLDHVSGLVATPSVSDGWMIGGDPLVLLHYDGQQWLSVPPPAMPKTTLPFISRLVMASPNEGWAVGFSELDVREKTQQGLTVYSSDGMAPLILHYHNGVWSVYNIS
jgi:hypothetical protein